MFHETKFMIFAVRPYCWLNKLRNTQGKRYGTYLGNIYGIYKEYIRNIHKYLWYKIIRTTGAALGLRRRPIGCVSNYFISKISMDIPYIFLIYSILYISWICSIYFRLCVSLKSWICFVKHTDLLKDRKFAGWNTWFYKKC